MICAMALAYSEATIDLDISTIDIASEILDQHADCMRYFLGLSESAGRDHLLISV